MEICLLYALIAVVAILLLGGVEKGCLLVRGAGEDGGTSEPSNPTKHVSAITAAIKATWLGENREIRDPSAPSSLQIFADGKPAGDPPQRVPNQTVPTNGIKRGFLHLPPPLAIPVPSPRISIAGSQSRGPNSATSPSGWSFIGSPPESAAMSNSFSDISYMGNLPPPNSNPGGNLQETSSRDRLRHPNMPRSIASGESPTGMTPSPSEEGTRFLFEPASPSEGLSSSGVLINRLPNPPLPN